MCYHCRKSGHLISGCWLLKKENESQTQKAPVGLINYEKSEKAVGKLVLLKV